MIKVILIVLTCLTLGYSIARLYTQHDADFRYSIDSIDTVSLVQTDAAVQPKAGQPYKSDPYKVSTQSSGIPDHSLDLPKWQANKHPSHQSLYTKVASKIDKISQWTKSGLYRFTSAANATAEASSPKYTSTSSSLGRPVYSSEEIVGDNSLIHGDRPVIGKVSIIVGDQPSNRLYERALRTHTAHNRLHNYQMFTLRESILDDVWTKPAYILSIILRELAKPAVERLHWLLWVDADTIILNPNIPAELFLPPETADGEWNDIHMLVTYDWNGLNNGVFPIRVHPWSVSLLSAILAFRHYRPDADLTFRDQSAMAMLLEEPAFRKHVMHAPQRWYNAYRGEINETIAPFQFRRGDFLVHFAGDPERDEHMRYWLERAEQHEDEWEVALKYTTYPGEVKEFWRAASLERRARQQAHTDAVNQLNDLIAQVRGALVAHASKIEDALRQHIESVISRTQTTLANVNASTKTIKEAHAELEKEAQTIMGHAAASMAATVKAAHEAIFEAEHVLFADVYTDQLKSEIQGVEEQLQQLRLKMQHTPLQEEQVNTATTYLAELVDALETRIESLQEAEDKQGAAIKVSTASDSAADRTAGMHTDATVAGAVVVVDAPDRGQGESKKSEDSPTQVSEAERVKAAEKDAADNWQKVKPGLPMEG